MRRAQFVGALDITGGIAGAGLVLAGILVLVMALSEPTFVRVTVAALLGAVGVALSLSRRWRTGRIILGTIALVAFVGFWVAALLIPDFGVLK